MRIFFVEGVDGSGKTTLIKNLCKYEDVVGYDAIPLNWNWQSQYNIWDEFLKNITFNSELKDKIVLIDRSPITEIVYRSVIDQRKPYMKLYDLLSLMNYYNICVIYCTNDKAFELAKKRGEDYIPDIETSNLICDMYDHFINTLMMGYYDIRYYNFEKISVSDMYKLLKEDLNAV